MITQLKIDSNWRLIAVHTTKEAFLLAIGKLKVKSPHFFWNSKQKTLQVYDGKSFMDLVATKKPTKKKK